jgi:hypothetical protein
MKHPTLATAQVPAPSSRHTDVWHAIREFDAVTAELEALLQRITSPHKGDEMVQPVPAPINPNPPSLAEFLNIASDDIRLKVEAAHETINRIASELF